jgi:hypothetical protein
MANQGVANTRNRSAIRVSTGVRLRSLQPSSMTIRGQVSGRLYELSGTSTDISVDSRDAVALEQTGFFRRV